MCQVLLWPTGLVDDINVLELNLAVESVLVNSKHAAKP